MEYQKIITNQPPKFKTKNWVEINYGLYGVYSTSSSNKLKTSMIRSNLCDYSDAYILVKGTLTVTNAAIEATPNNRNKEVIFKNYALFTDCMTEINNKEIDHAKDIDVVMAMYNLIEYIGNYSKISVSLWQYYRDEPFIDNNRAIIDIPDHLNNISFNCK